MNENDANEIDPAASELRRAKRARRLGPDSACAICGRTELALLTTVDRRLLEAHHVAGRANDADAVVVVCLNDHAMLSARQLDVGVFAKDYAGPFLDTAIRALRSFATFAELLPAMLYGFANLLDEFGRQLDVQWPQWRTSIIVGGLT